MSHRSRTAPGGAARIGVLLAAVALLVVACGSGDSSGAGTTDPSQFSGYVRTPPLNVSKVTLPSAAGTPVNMAAAPNGLRIVYFGYTSCPDVCPTTLSDLKRALARLPARQRDRVQVDMVTIDPARDTAEKLSQYVTTFIADGGALRTDDQTLLRSATAAFGANYDIQTGADGTPEVSHSSEVYAVDDTGEVVLAWPFGTSSKDLARDIGRLLDGQRPSSG